MGRLANSRLSWLLVSGGVLCAGQSKRDTAMQWVDYYTGVYRVPPALVHAVIEVESAWQPRAVSKEGAAGLMQLMPATAATFGVTNRFDDEQNIRGGVAYLARLLDLFHGDLRLATAAYATGEGRILRAGLQYSNAEVFAYVSRVAGLYRQEQRIRATPTGGNSP
jgi:soluble lytic murein transglycosylase-like protein